jgi:hypothetical protein
MNPGVIEAHPVQLTIRDDLRRSRLTVFLRWLLAIPHYVWWALWTVGVFFAAIAGWIFALLSGRLPPGLHSFFSKYINYTAHLFGYLLLVTNPYPEFVGQPGPLNPLDVSLPDEPVPQPRWKTLLRIVLVIPSLLVAAALGGAGSGGFTRATATRSGRPTGTRAGFQAGGVTTVTSVLGWFVCVVRGRMPKGFRDTGGYVIGYWSQLLAYLLLVTDRYPNPDPTTMLASVERPPVHPVHMVGDSEDLRMSRLTVLFRLPLLIPLVVWLVLWTVVAGLASIVQWVVTLVSGRPIASFHRFLSRWVRFEFHVYAFGALVANPFPSFAGRFGLYPLDLVLPEPARQNRWKTAFRLILAFPALIVSSALGGALVIDAILTWFTALATGRAPEGLRNLSAFALRYQGQANAYLFFVTDTYPHSSPLEGGEPEEDEEPVAFAEPLWPASEAMPAPPPPSENGGLEPA